MLVGYDETEGPQEEPGILQASPEAFLPRVPEAFTKVPRSGSRSYGAVEHIDDPLNAYIDQVRNTVANTLRCRVDGEPADWVCQELHEAACGMGLAPPHLTQPPPIVSMDVNITVSTGWGWVWLRKHTYPDGDPFTINDEPFTAFASWDQLRKAAHEHVDKAIDTLKDEMDSVTASWPLIGKGYRTDTTVTMPKLARWLVEGKRMYMGDQTATNKLLHELGLDPL
jgi:hypothetical protein